MPLQPDMSIVAVGLVHISLSVAAALSHPEMRTTAAGLLSDLCGSRPTLKREYIKRKMHAAIMELPQVWSAATPNKSGMLPGALP